MHAVAQVMATRELHGRGRFSLWPGDLGMALYLRACVDADPRPPFYDLC